MLRSQITEHALIILTLQSLFFNLRNLIQVIFIIFTFISDIYTVNVIKYKKYYNINFTE